MSVLEQNQHLARNLIEEAHKFYALKYQMSDGGNLSVRIPDAQSMIVKGSNIDFGSVSLDTIVIADFDGHLLEGSIKPSKESLLHGAIYRACPDIGAIMHCHSPWATAWAAHHDFLAFSTHHADLKLGGECPVFDTNSYVVPVEFFEKIIQKMKQSPLMKAFLLRGHGQVAFGKTIHAAAITAELVEETAMIARLARE